ncbi:MAG: hypothetical protein WDA09_08825, partial [Bacteriovoracaceae bacterium]
QDINKDTLDLYELDDLGQKALKSWFCDNLHCKICQGKPPSIRCVNQWNVITYDDPTVQESETEETLIQLGYSRPTHWPTG